MRKAILILLVSFMSILVACSNDDDKAVAEEPVIAVETTEAIEGDLVVEKSIYGRAMPIKTTPLLAQAPGELDVLKVEEGDKVKKEEHIATVKTAAGTQKIDAPKEGEIMQLDVEEGDMISDSDPFALIVQLKEMKVEFAVTDQVRSLVGKEDKLKLTVKDEELEAEVTKVGKMPDDTGLYPIEAKVKNEDEILLPGMVTQVHIPEKRVKKSVILPTEAIVEEDDRTFVYLVEGDQVKQVDITILATQSDQTAIEGEIKAEDELVINGQLTLTDGSKVDIVKEGS